ncbi:MAG TPA: M28 family peptidase, partial [Thermoanaerobaculia bacterium]
MVDQFGDRTVVEPARPPGWGLIAGLALLALVLGLTVFQSKPPAPKAKEVPLTEFSAGRAGDILRNLAGDGSPRPVGSPANAQAREKILGHLRWLGYTPEVQEAVACDWGGCARVWNILARLEGREKGKAVLLMAHYDSVPAGPGVGDDLTGVAAVLEIARVLKAGPPPRNPVLFLLDDAEEEGLLGARAFASRHPAASQVGVVVNLEARGSGGPSLMFETSGADAVPVAAFAAGAEKPFTSSLFPTVYEFLPNDTDLTIFKRRGVPGLNFAYIENPTHYHTPLDNLENASPASLQHHGDNALAAVRGLVETDLSRPLEGKSVFFDLFRSTVVRWPAGLTPVLALLALALTVGTVVLSIRKGMAARRGVVSGVLTALAALVFIVMAGFALQALLAGVFQTPWVARPMPAIVAFWLLALAVTLGAAALLAQRFRAPALWGGVWTVWAVLGLLLSFTLPGISYLFVVPALVAGVCGLLFGRSPNGWIIATIVPALVAGVLWFPVLLMLYSGLGLQGLLVTAVLLSLLLGTLIPVTPASGSLGRKWIPLAAVIGVIVGTVMAMISPPFTASSPRGVDLQLHQDGDTGESRWIVRSAPPIPPTL